MTRKRFAVIGAMGLAMVLGLGSAVQATPLNLWKAPPDIYSCFLDVAYDAGAGSLSVSGFPWTLELPGNPPVIRNITGASKWLSLAAPVDNSGALTGPGSFTINGELDLDGNGSVETTGLLLSGIIEEFGYPDGPGDIFEFGYRVDGGALAPNFHGVGAPGGMIVSAFGAGFDGSFAGSFQNQGEAAADTFVPEPAAVASLAGLALCGLIFLIRRRRG